MSQSLEDKVFSVLDKYKQDKFLVAVSGGADSMALVSSLYSSAPLRERLHVLHVDHGLRGQESKDDADFVSSFCEERSIPCRIVTIPEGDVLSYAKNHKTGIEAAARHFRRKALLDEAHRIDNCEPRSIILTAHTKDDALELSLMRILRGAGPAGLSAMPVKHGRFIRPLLNVTREEIIAYLKEKNIPWREDSSNKNEKFLRNKIRHKLIPFLDEFISASRRGAETQSTRNWRKGIEGMAATQSLAAEFIDFETEQRIVWRQGTGDKEQSLITDEKIFFSQSQIIREESIYKALNLLCVLSGSASLRERIPKRYVIRQFCEGKARAYDLGTVRIIRKKGKIIILPGKKRLR